MKPANQTKVTSGFINKGSILMLTVAWILFLAAGCYFLAYFARESDAVFKLSVMGKIRWEIPVATWILSFFLQWKATRKLLEDNKKNKVVPFEQPMDKSYYNIG